MTLARFHLKWHIKLPRLFFWPITLFRIMEFPLSYLGYRAFVFVNAWNLEGIHNIVSPLDVFYTWAPELCHEFYSKRTCILVAHFCIHSNWICESSLNGWWRDVKYPSIMECGFGLMDECTWDKEHLNRTPSIPSTFLLLLLCGYDVSMLMYVSICIYIWFNMYVYVCVVSNYYQILKRPSSR